jgi:hypothetical protein
MPPTSLPLCVARESAIRLFFALGANRAHHTIIVLHIISNPKAKSNSCGHLSAFSPVLAKEIVCILFVLTTFWAAFVDFFYF